MNKCLSCGKPVNNKYCNVSCQNRHQNTKKAEQYLLKRKGEIKEFEVLCYNCNKSFTVKEREKEFPKKEKYYCCRSCANTRHPNDKTKKKISDTLINLNIFNKTLGIVIKRKKYCINHPRKIKIHEKLCMYCGKEFNTRKKKQKFCCRSCATIFHNINNRDILVKAGLKSVQTQSENRRSKNEMYFAELCKQCFKNVKTNEAIFNGWDADVILENEKIAVLWNGKWHYEKLNKKHSVTQVQNRDEIKIKEIKNAGYMSYVIQDMGKYNKEFVEKQFEIFKQYIVGWSNGNSRVS